MTFYIVANGMYYDFGTITSFTDSYTRGLITTPIPSMPTDRTFAIETNAALRYYVSFVRKCPLDPDNSFAVTSDRWDNGTWLSRVSSLTNRWQARSNGYELVVTNTDTGALGAPNFGNPERVFISEVTYNYKEGEPDNLYGTMTLLVTDQLGQKNVAAMDVNPNGLSDISINYRDLRTETPTPDSDMYVMISSSDGYDWYLLQKGRQIQSNGEADYDVDYSKQTDIVKSYNLHGGPSDPFEYIEMSLSRKAIIEQCPALDGDILAGCNKLIINGVSSASMIVTKCRLTNNTYEIMAYNTSEVIRSYQLEPIPEMPTVSMDGTPLEIITKVVVEYAGVAEENIVTNVTDLTYNVSVKSKTNAWTAVQLCAMALNAKPFFAEGKFFLIDYTKLVTYQSSEYYPSYRGVFFGDLDLHPVDEEDMMYGRVTGNIDIGSEGIDTVINGVSIHYGTAKTTGEDNNTYTDQLYYENTDNDSAAKYTACDYSALSVDQYLVVDEDDPDSRTRAQAFAQAVGDFILAYRAEPQTSIGFTMKERVSTGDQCGWLRAFPNVCAARSISSEAENVKSTAESTYAVNQGGSKVIKPQKLIMSSYCHNYPEFTTKYWFGVIENVDLSQSTSNIRTHVGMS